MSQTVDAASISIKLGSNDVKFTGVPAVIPSVHRVGAEISQLQKASV